MDDDYLDSLARDTALEPLSVPAAKERERVKRAREAEREEGGKRQRERDQRS